MRVNAYLCTDDYGNRGATIHCYLDVATFLNVLANILVIKIVVAPKLSASSMLLLY